MKKIVTIISILLFTGSSTLLGNFYICRNDDCAMYVIEDNEGYSWHIECNDGSTETGRTGDGASYEGNCQKMDPPTL